MSEACASNDLVKSNKSWLLWGLPAVLLAVGTLAPTLRPFLWTPALLLAGGACVANAATCGRLHCYITGPLYLGLAILTVVRATDVLTFPWAWIVVAMVGGTVLAYIPEWIRGEYVTSKT